MHQVRYFVALCETLNFTRAAERSNVAQPSLTRAIKLLEEELGGPLFNRERNNTHLTELGRMMEPHLREVLAQATGARSRARSFFELKAARLKIGIARGVGLRLVQHAIERFAQAYPDTDIMLVDERPATLGDALRQGELELVVLPERPHDIDDLHYYALGGDRLQVLVRPDHRFAELTAVPARELLGETLITREGCRHFSAIEQRLANDGLLVRPRVIAGDPSWLPILALRGLGVAITAQGYGVPDGLLARPVLELTADQQVALATKRGRLYSPPVKAFVDIALKPLPAPPAVSAA